MKQGRTKSLCIEPMAETGEGERPRRTMMAERPGIYTGWVGTQGEVGREPRGKYVCMDLDSVNDTISNTPGELVLTWDGSTRGI